MNSRTNSESYYDILGIDSKANAKEIRQAYLKQAVKYHPDKNPAERYDTAKSRFVMIGQAYEVLSDSSKRAAYDRDLRMGRTNNNNDYANRDSTDNCEYDESYTSYRDAFDKHVAGMSESEVSAVIGLAAIVGGFVGSVLAKNLASSANTNNNTRGNAGSNVSSLLSSFGSVAGSMLASQAAADVVRQIHQSSVERVAYQKEQERVQRDGGYSENSSYDPNFSQTGRQSGGTYSTEENSNSNKKSEITLEHVISAVETGLRMWQNASKQQHR